MLSRIKARSRQRPSGGYQSTWTEWHASAVGVEHVVKCFAALASPERMGQCNGPFARVVATAQAAHQGVIKAATSAFDGGLTAVHDGWQDQLEKATAYDEVKSDDTRSEEWQRRSEELERAQGENPRLARTGSTAACEGCSGGRRGA